MSFPEALDLRRASLPRPSLGKLTAKLHRPSRMHLVLALVVLMAVVAGSWMLVRNSSLVAVNDVKVVGLSGYYDKQARAAVVAEAMQMTTMNFDESRVSEAANGFVDVAGVKVETDFPHGATIFVDVRRPVLVARISGRLVTLSQTGEVLSNTRATVGLPHISANGRIVDNHLVAGKALSAARVLGAAPDVLMRKVDSIRFGKLGIVVSLENGPDLYFGSSAQARTKWRDAAAVLASPKSKGAAYVDLRVPGRPAIGGLGAAPTTLSPASALDATDTASADDAAATATADQTTQTAPAQTETPAATTPQEQAPAPATTPQQTAPAAGGAGPG
jgi:cell division septal protein FtsQ